MNDLKGLGLIRSPLQPRPDLAAPYRSIREFDGEGSPRTRLAFDTQAAVMSLRDDVITHRQTQACSTARRLRGEKRLENLILNIL